MFYPASFKGINQTLLYGSVDNGKKICWNEDFHSKVLEAAKHLHLKEHTVRDGSGNVFKLAAPEKCNRLVEGLAQRGDLLVPDTWFFSFVSSDDILEEVMPGNIHEQSLSCPFLMD